MAQSTTPNAHTLASAMGIHRLDGSRHARCETVKTLRGLGFDEGFIQSSLRTLDGQIRTSGEGQVMLVDFRRGPFAPIAIVETA